MQFIRGNDSRQTQPSRGWGSGFFLDACPVALAVVAIVFHAPLVPCQTIPATLPDLKLATPGYVQGLALQDDGRLLVAGGFSSVGDLPQASLARLNPNGTLDLTWTPTISPLSGPALAIVANEHSVYVGSSGFEIKGTAGRRGIARLSRLDGSLDAQWAPALMGNQVQVWTMALSGAHLILGGDFTVNLGQTESNFFAAPMGLAKVAAEGSGAADTNWNAGADGVVQRLVVSGTNLFVAGTFTTIGGLPRQGLAKLSLAHGRADPIWDPGLILNEGWIRSLVVVGTNLFVLGDFASIGGLPINTVAKLSTEGIGAVDPDWKPRIPGAPQNQSGDPPHNWVGVLAATNRAVFIGGFTTDTTGCRSFLIKAGIDGPGEVDSSWVSSANLADEANSYGAVYSLVPSASGLFVGGFFARLGSTGKFATPALAVGLMDPETGDRHEGFQGQVQNPGQVSALARQPDGRLIVAGRFESAGGLARHGLARVEADGRIDGTWAPSVDGTIDSLAVSTSGLFLRGSFTRVNGVPRKGLAKVTLDRSDAVDGWELPITNPAAEVGGMVVIDPCLFVTEKTGSGFGSIGGLPRHALAKISTVIGSADPTWVADVPEGVRVTSMVSAGTDLFLHGRGAGPINNEPIHLLAKVSAFGPGMWDADWRPFELNQISPESVVGLLGADPTNLFISVQPSGLAKVSTVGVGQVDLLWRPRFGEPDLGATVVVSTGDDLYVAGQFLSLGGQPCLNLARIGTSGTGVVDTTFASMASGDCRALLAAGNDLYAGGTFQEIGGAIRNGFAFLPVVAAPGLIQDTATNLLIIRNALDGPEVTHFYMLAVEGEALFRTDGTRVRAGDFLTVAQGEAGLKFAPGGTVVVASAVNATVAGASSKTSSLTLSAVPGPTFRLASANYGVREGQGNVVLTVRKYGSGFGTVDYLTVDQTATGDQLGAVGADYRSRNGTLVFSAADQFKNVIIPIADDLQNEGDEQFFVRLQPSPNTTAILAPPATATVTIVDNDVTSLSESHTNQVAPLTAPESDGVLTVSLVPPDIGGQWRLSGDLGWHNGGESLGGLVTGNYRVEFRAVSGYGEPITRMVSVITGTTNRVTFDYAVALFPAGTGDLTVSIEPAAVATAPDDDTALRGKWRRPGTTEWRNSDEREPDLPEGLYAVEFRPVPGRLTPPPQDIWVAGDGATHGAVATYLFESSSPGGPAPEVVPFEESTVAAPYCFNGQIHTSVGFGSGFVVKPKVVLTAAHVLFDDGSLSYVTEAQWFFQRYRGDFEPVPQTPRGWYVFEGYAAQREIDQSPGISTPDSQNRDVAAMYFLEPAGRGGYGGYLSSDADDNDHLLNAGAKFLAGYPVEGVAEASRGQLHASTPAILQFVRLYGSVFATEGVQGFPGNSGGPLYVQTDVDTYHPAAVYLGGTAQTLVRAINSEVVDLINRADTSANGGGNSTGGGVTIIGPGVTVSPLENGRLTVRMQPSDMSGPRPGWRVVFPNPVDYITNASVTVALIGGAQYPLEFKPVAGFITPARRTVFVPVSQEVSIRVDYVPLPGPALAFNPSQGLTLSGMTGLTVRVEWASNLRPPIAWMPLTNVTLSTSPIDLTNILAAPDGNRFYRGVLVP